MILPGLARVTSISDLVLVAITFLGVAFSADIAFEGFVPHMSHNVIPHIAESDCSLATQSTDENLVSSASIWVGIHALVELRFDVGSRVLM